MNNTWVAAGWRWSWRGRCQVSGRCPLYQTSDILGRLAGQHIAMSRIIIFCSLCQASDTLEEDLWYTQWLGPLSEAVTNNWTREQGGMDCPSVIVIVNVFQIFLSILFPEKWKTPRCGQSRKYLSPPFPPPLYSSLVEAFSPFISKDRIWGEKCVRGWRIGKLEWILCKFTKSFYHVLQVLELGSNIVFSIDQHLWAATKIM